MTTQTQLVGTMSGTYPITATGLGFLQISNQGGVDVFITLGIAPNTTPPATPATSTLILPGETRSFVRGQYCCFSAIASGRGPGKLLIQSF